MQLEILSTEKYLIRKIIWIVPVFNYWGMSQPSLIYVNGMWLLMFFARITRDDCNWHALRCYCNINHTKTLRSLLNVIVLTMRMVVMATTNHKKSVCRRIKLSRNIKWSDVRRFKGFMSVNHYNKENGQINMPYNESGNTINSLRCF